MENGRTFYSPLFIVLAGLFIAALVAANIISVKLIAVGDWFVPAGVVIFPLSYIFGDVLTEVYGFKAARRVIWLGFMCNLLVVAAIWVAGLWPAAPFWKDQQAYNTILGFTPRLLLASFIAYLIGEFANSIVMARMKVATEGKWLWSRTIGSTLIGEGLDSVVFITLAFAGLPNLDLTTAIITQWLIKVTYEVVATPVTYMVVGFLKRQEGMDVYDRQTSFNPLAIAD
ncbi:MAG: queuosine precursor transporter [Chloroflexota bacterium]|nr:queuosine precursor transporter [Chloroflexota bacterium]